MEGTVKYYRKEYSVNETYNAIMKFYNSPRGRGVSIDIAGFKAKISENPKFVIKAAKFLGVKPILA
jgi:hypothetical protein